MIEPGMGGGDETTVREEYKVVNDDKHEMLMYADYTGMGEVMMMENGCGTSREFSFYP
jgi:hypothetical protein